MNIVITGAGGFVGGVLAREIIKQGNFTQLTLVDQQLKGDFNEPGVRVITGALQDSEVRRTILEPGVDLLYHLAAVPGGASEADPALSQLVNLEATLALFNEAAAVGNCPRIVYSSTIAVLPTPLPNPVDDSCPLLPEMTYGTHKAMVEFALADMCRRGQVDAVAVRLPGIIARPLAPSGLKSAFLSNIFHALKAGERFVSPVSSAATFWVMSVNQCVSNLLTAKTLDSQLMPGSRVVTFPAIRCSMAELVQCLCATLGVPETLVEYSPEAALERLFGSQPPLETPAAEQAGFSHDGGLQQLVDNTLAAIDA